MSPRPLAITLIGWLFIATGVIGFAYHANEFRAHEHPGNELVWVLAVRLSAILCGVLILRGSDWGRWGALAWIAYHVALSAFHSVSELVTHVTIFVALASLLLRPAAAAYFRAAPALVPDDSQNR